MILLKRAVCMNDVKFRGTNHRAQFIIPTAFQVAVTPINIYKWPYYSPGSAKIMSPRFNADFSIFLFSHHCRFIRLNCKHPTLAQKKTHPKWSEAALKSKTVSIPECSTTVVGLHRLGQGIISDWYIWARYWRGSKTLTGVSTGTLEAEFITLCS